MFPALITIGGALSGLLKLVLPNVKSIAEVFVGNKAARDQYNAEADKAAQESFAKEFSYPLGAARTTFDVAIDAINRLPRPLIVYSLWLMLLLTCLAPHQMADAYRAMAIIPEMLWNITLVVVGFFFAGRMVEKLDWKRGYKTSPASSDYGSEPQSLMQRAVGAQASALGLMGGASALAEAEQRDELLRLAGYGPGVLTTHGFTGRLPPSRSSGWRNPIAQRYSASS